MNYKNNAFSVLASSITSEAAALSVSTGTGSRFPSADFPATLIGYDGSGNENAWEIVRCTARSGDLLTIVRAQEGTTATAWPAAARIENRVTAGSMDGLQNKQMVSDAEPSIRYHGDEWTDGTTGIKYTWIEDGTSGQWVELGPGGAKKSWLEITDKPAVIAAGADAAAARAAIGAAAEGETISIIRLPANTSPAAGATSVTENPTLTGSTYYSLYSTPMAASQWQVSTDSSFATTVISTGDVAGAAITYTLASGLLAVNTAYFWRVRYKDAEGVYSDWSAPTSFTTAANFNAYIATPTATPAAFGDPLEGGFYTGMIWNELVQSASSMTIGTGAKTFTVPNMSSAPIVYVGQQLEVRSRANPANKMVGTVTGALGTTLTLNIESGGGGGTFADWSIMSRYRVIVAPKASGENASIAYKNANTAAPAATGTLTEGRKATLAMVGADTPTVYPAAHWCNNLSIGGRTDWYLPARDELELCWRNLKPATDANYTSADRSASATPNYQNLGSFGGAEATHGLNKNSAPAGAEYTSGAPAQTAAAAFRTGGAEAYEFGSAYYWSSSEYSASYAWSQNWGSSYPSYQGGGLKAGAGRVRAVRRSII